MLILSPLAWGPQWMRDPFW